MPSFAPEILRRVKLKDAMKAKKMKEALQQMAEEGVVQVFSPHDGAPAIVGVVGALQLDVLKERMAAEYSIPVEFEPCSFAVCRWVSAPPGADGAPGDPAAVEKFMASHRFSMADDLDDDPVFLASSAFNLRYEAERAGEGVRFTDLGTIRRGSVSRTARGVHRSCTGLRHRRSTIAISEAGECSCWARLLLHRPGSINEADVFGLFRSHLIISREVPLGAGSPDTVRRPSNRKIFFELRRRNQQPFINIRSQWRANGSFYRASLNEIHLLEQEAAAMASLLDLSTLERREPDEFTWFKVRFHGAKSHLLWHTFTEEGDIELGDGDLGVLWSTVQQFLADCREAGLG